MEILLMSQYAPEKMRRSKKMKEVRKYKKSSAPRLRWTPQLHEIFIQTVEHLGGRNKATPKRTLQMMAIKELKLSHVKSHLQMYRNMKEHPSLHVMMPDFNLSSPLLREHAPESSKQKESGSQNGENIHYNDYQEAEDSISSGMTKMEEEDNAGGPSHEIYYELPKADGEGEKERIFWPNMDDHHKIYSQFNNASTRENSNHINLDLSLSWEQKAKSLAHRAPTLPTLQRLVEKDKSWYSAAH